MTPGGFEPPIFAMRTRCPRPLDDGAFISLWQIANGKMIIAENEGEDNLGRAGDIQ